MKQNFPHAEQIITKIVKKELMQSVFSRVEGLPFDEGL